MYLCFMDVHPYKTIFMDHHETLNELHQDTVKKLEEFVKSKENLKEEDHEKLHAAKSEWQDAWNKLRDLLMVLERIEI